MQPLAGIRVLDLTQIMAGPYCTMVLGDMGAEVIKIEKIQGGDDSRQMGPYVDGESTCFMQINRNKKSVALDLKSEDGLQLFRDLAGRADVIVENFRPGVTASLGVDFESVRAINPQIIYCSISGFGQTGPYSEKGGFDLVAQGMSGLMSMTGEPERRPVKTGVAVYDIGAGMTAVYSILAAYIHRQASGEGQHVDVAVAECGLPWFTWEAAAYFAEGTVPERTGWRHRISAPYQALRTADGYLVLGCANQRTWERFCEHVVAQPQWLEDSRFRTNQDRRRNVDALEALIEEQLGERETAHWLERCDAAGVPAGPINDFAEALGDPHFQARDMVQSFEHPVAGTVRTMGFPAKLSGTPARIRLAAPTLGEHTDAVLTELGLDESRVAALRQAGIVA